MLKLDLVGGDPNNGHEVASVSVASDAPFDRAECGDCGRAFGSGWCLRRVGQAHHYRYPDRPATYPDNFERI
jgi:hypothetical protein